MANYFVDGHAFAPNAMGEIVVRLTNVVLLALAGVAMGALCRRLGVHPILCFVAGLYVSLSPILIWLALDGMSEISFIALVTAGLVMIFSSPHLLYPGAFLIGLGPLVRTNFVLVPVIFVGLALLIPSARRVLLERGTKQRAVLALCIALLPTLVWLIRNYTVTGRFPLMSTIYGETFYGSYNDRVATELESWGASVFPDNIPGETPKYLLARRLPNDLALNDYYTERGNEWISEHMSALPRLTLGRLVRAYVPIPWANEPTTEQWLACGTRVVLELLFLLTIPYWWPTMKRQYLLFLLTLAMVHLFSTVLLHGSVRYTFAFLEVFAIPVVVYGMDRWAQSRRRWKLFSAPSTPAQFART